MGVRETYLKKVTEYAVDPFAVLYSLQGQAIHAIHEKNAEGIFDLYGICLMKEME